MPFIGCKDGGLNFKSAMKEQHPTYQTHWKGNQNVSKLARTHRTR